MNNAVRRGTNDVSRRPISSSPIQLLCWAAGISCVLYLVIAISSRYFGYHVASTSRPIITALSLFGTAFAIYVFSIGLIRKIPDERPVLTLVVGSSIAFRVLLLFSVPIQEIDIYRYVWDGAVSTTGVSPFTFSPEQVRTATIEDADSEMRKLLTLLNREPALQEILSRVHFAELPTIYPPTSQAVFALAGFTTPTGTPAMARLVIMKAWIMMFDLGTFWILIKLLSLSGMHRGYLIVYSWCPLLMKEVANSGHLDAIAVLLTSLAVYLVAKTVNSKETDRLSSPTRMATLGLFVLALAIGAKIYPVVVAPLIFFVLARKLGFYRLIIPTLLFCISTIVIISPMMPKRIFSKGENDNMGSVESVEPDGFSMEDLPPPLMESSSETSLHQDPSEGLRAFINHWEMNDFLFLILVENLKPTSDLKPHRVAWFSVLPEKLRTQVSRLVMERFNVDSGNVSFLVTRCVLSFVFVVLAVAISWKAARKGTVESFLQATFLTLAWFWLLCPTQNPWYWTWALPFLPFMRNRAWFAVSGLVLLYYLRFYFQYHFPDPGVFNTRYDGARFFDFVVTWIEFAPWFVWLAAESVVNKNE